MRYSHNSLFMRGSKGDYTRQKQNKGSALPVDTEPLFPRLHVSETEKHGSKGPPRNRMALYEHLTVPSHRFVQKTDQNQQSTSNGCPLVSQCVPSLCKPIDIKRGVHASAQSSYGASSDEQEILLVSMIGNSKSAGVSSCISRLDSDDSKDKMDEQTDDNKDGKLANGGTDEKTCSSNGGLTKKAKAQFACDVRDDSVSVFSEEGNQLNSMRKLHDGTAMANEAQPSPTCIDKKVFRPKDVMLQIGQQHFWKARKVLLRQQRVFSDQVFQLHRLIKVQKLLAETPGTLIDDKEIDIGPIDECNTAKLIELTNENVKGSVKEKKMDPDAETISTKQGTTTKASLISGMKVRTITPFPVSNPSFMWGNTNMGSGQWMTPVTPQTYPMYHPIAGHFSSGVCYNALYGYPTIGSVSTGIPVGFPHSVGNYGAIPQPADASKNDPIQRVGQTPPGCIPYHYPGSWYTYSDYHPNYGQNLHSDCSINAASTISSISTNKNHPSTLEGTQSINIKQQCVNHVGLPLHKGFPDSHAFQTENVSQNDDIALDRRPHEQLNEVDQMSSGTGQVDGHQSMTLELFPVIPARHEADKKQSQVIKSVPRSAIAASQSAAGILLSLQHERQQHSLSCA